VRVRLEEQQKGTQYRGVPLQKRCHIGTGTDSITQQTTATVAQAMTVSKTEHCHIGIGTDCITQQSTATLVQALTVTHKSTATLLRHWQYHTTQHCLIVKVRTVSHNRALPIVTNTDCIIQQSTTTLLQALTVSQQSTATLLQCCILLYTSLGPSQKRIVDVTSGRS